MADASAEGNPGLIGAGGPLRCALGAIELFPCPVVAMVRGYAVGVALELALACDPGVVPEKCRIGMTAARSSPSSSRKAWPRLMALHVAPAFDYRPVFSPADAAADQPELFRVLDDHRVVAFLVEVLP